MGKIRKLLENELIGGVEAEDIYPITAFKAVYDSRNVPLDIFLKRNLPINISVEYSSTGSAEVLDLSSAISKVPEIHRTLGFIGSFLAEDGWTLCRFTGESVSDWNDSSKWTTANLDSVINQLGVLSDNIGTINTSIKTLSNLLTSCWSKNDGYIIKKLKIESNLSFPELDTIAEPGLYMACYRGSPLFLVLQTFTRFASIPRTVQWIFGDIEINEDGTITSSTTSPSYGHNNATIIYRTGSSLLDWGAWKYVFAMINNEQVFPPKQESIYPKIVTWSGKTVDGVTVLSQSISEAVESEIVYDTVKKTFLIEKTNLMGKSVYYNNSLIMANYQKNVYTSFGSFSAGFYNNTYYKGLNGSIWVATSESDLVMLTYMSGIGVDDQLSETSTNPVQNKVITSNIKKIITIHD